MDDTRQISKTNFGVSNPAIRRVLDAESGDEVDVDELLGTDEASVMELRFDVKKAILDDRAKYLCPECFVPVSLIARKEARRFYFRHLVEGLAEFTTVATPKSLGAQILSTFQRP